MFADLRYRLRALFLRRDLEADLDEELRFHLDHEAAKLVARGMPPEEARRQARLAFGSVDAAKEQSRDWRGVIALETSMRDVRYALRVLAKTPVFTAVAVLSLAIGIGANTAVFSVVNAVWLKSLAIRDPGSLVMVSPDDRFPQRDYPLLSAFRARTEVFADVAGVATTDRSNISIGGDPNTVEPRPASIHLVTGNYFSLLGVTAARGRMIAQDDDLFPGRHPVAVISDDYWRRRFASDPNVIGRTLGLNGVFYTVIGVAPAAFTGDTPGLPADLWMPTMMQSQVMVERPGLLTNSRTPWIRMITRLAPGSTPARAAAVATTLYKQILMDRVAMGQTILTAAEVAKQSVEMVPAGRGYSPYRAVISGPVALVWGIVLAVLLLACVNVAGLLLARSITREREIATRLAIGAGRGRITRQLLTEGLVLSTMSGTLGLFASWLGVRSLQRVVHSGADAFTFDVTIDARVLVATAGVCLFTGLLCGLAPAIRAGRASLLPSLAAQRSTSFRRRRGVVSLGQSLVIAQVGLTLTLVVAAGLLGRTMLNLRTRDIGFDRSHLLLAWTAPPQAGIVRERLAPLYEAAAVAIASIPGVRSVAVSSRGILGSNGTGSPIRVPGYVARPDDGYFVGWNLISPNFFDAIGNRLLAGREFTVADDESANRVAVISQSLAKHYFGTDNPIGKRFGMRGGEDFPIEIVGVARDVIDLSLHESSGVDMIYLPYRQDVAHLMEMCVIVRTVASGASLAESVRRVLRQVDPALPVLSVVTLNGQLSRSLVQERLVSLLAGLFGVVALVLVSIGLYAIVAQSVAMRASELAVRLALGGSPTTLVAMILRESVVVVGAGLGLGVITALFAVRAIDNQLFGVSAFDPATMTIAVVLMIVTTIIAAYVPAARAARTDPISALRAG